MVEVATGVCDSPQEALAALAELRAAAAEAAVANGLLVAASGTHPFSVPEQQDIAPDPRYKEFVAYAGISARRQAVCGLHVHVGMPGPEECMRALEGVLPWLPLILALSANSPYLAGEETGLASKRAEVLALLPRAAAPPAFTSYAEWEAFVERYVRLGLADGYTRFWWDARPHPSLGTLEIRSADQPTAPELSAAFAALLQALCVTAVEGPAAGGREPRGLRTEPLGCTAFRPARRARPSEGRPAREGAGAPDGATRARRARGARAGYRGAAVGAEPRALRGRPAARDRPGAGPRGRCRRPRRADGTIGLDGERRPKPSRSAASAASVASAGLPAPCAAMTASSSRTRT